MRNSIKAAFVAVSLCIAGTASATPVPAYDQSYEGIFNINNAYPHHGLYLPGLTAGLGGDTRWGVTGGEATYVSNTLTLEGSAVNKTASNLSLDFNFSLNEKVGYVGTAYCGQSGGSGCSSTAAADVAAREEIKFFDLATATLKGTAGTDLEGLLIELTVKPGDGSKPPQFGYGANWLNMAFGYSNWFYYDVVKQANDPNFAVTANSWGGDINLTFTGSDSQLPPVPLPAGLPLLLGALGVMGIVGRKRRS